MIYRYETASSDRYHQLKELAKKNRNNPTMAERFLWKQLKGCALGVKFQRQHIVYDYIADFICIEKKLIIEVDGEYHFTEEQKQYDDARTDVLTSFGYKIIRFTNNEVLYKTLEVIQTIKQSI